MQQIAGTTLQQSGSTPPHARLSGLRAIYAGLIRWLLVIPCIGLYGCYSTGLPPKSNPPSIEDSLVETLPWTLAIDDSLRPLPRLATDLSSLGLFHKVAQFEQLPDADLILTPGTRLRGEDPIPLWTFLTLGVVPTVISEEIGHRFELSPGPRHQHCAAAPLEIDATYPTRSVGGWLALPMNLHPNRTVRDPYQSSRFRTFFKNAVLDRTNDIAELMCGADDG